MLQESPLNHTQRNSPFLSKKFRSKLQFPWLIFRSTVPKPCSPWSIEHTASLSIKRSCSQALHFIGLHPNLFSSNLFEFSIFLVVAGLSEVLSIEAFDLCFELLNSIKFQLNSTKFNLWFLSPWKSRVNLVGTGVMYITTTFIWYLDRGIWWSFYSLQFWSAPEVGRRRRWCTPPSGLQIQS